jgi:SAM-dependent methyltransferase
MIESNLYPDFFARFYDVIYDKVRSDADHDYFMQKILGSEGPVLEVGVGTGRFFLEALKRGVDIHGLDISPAMIDVLKAKLPRENHWRVRVGDVCTIGERPGYNLIVAPFRVFMHFLTIEKQLEALQAMHAMLLPGGRLVFDLFVPNLKMLSEGLDNFLDFEGEYEPGKILKRYSSMTADLVNQISRVTFRLEWEEGDKTHAGTWVTELRFFFRYELEHLLYRSVFNRYSLYGDFNEGAPGPKSKEFIVECFA